jgi:quercetin dioxygenase-like cupin family protein
MLKRKTFPLPPKIRFQVSFRKITLLALVAALLHAGSAYTQTPTAPLPRNYKTILQNHDLLIMRVHYGPHEVVPMHDHSAYPTIFVYLNDSGELRIDHAPPASFSVTRPPTHTGAFRISPGMTERHSITNLGDEPSDFLRVELKSIPPADIEEVTRGAVPSPLLPGTHAEFDDPALHIDRIVCPPTIPCEAPPTQSRSILISITPLKFQASEAKHSLNPGEVAWLPANSPKPLQLSPDAQALRITLLYPQ